MIIKNYKHFMLLESVLELNPNFYSMMCQCALEGNKIAEYIYNVYRHDTDVKTNVNKVDMSLYKNSEVTFLPDSQYQRIKDTDEWSKRTRSVGNIGRIIRQILKDNNFQFTDKELEDFVNLYKSKWDKDYSGRKVEMVKGDDILFWYNETNYYSSGGTLGNSCMRNPAKNKYMKLYAENPDKVSLVILTKDNKLMGRALLWKLDDNSLGADFYCDRIYYRFDSDAGLIKEWVASNVKGKVVYHDDGFDEDDKVKVNLEKTKFEKYPYMDTFHYLYVNLKEVKYEGVSLYEEGDGGFLSPFVDDVDGYIPYELEDTSGGRSRCGGKYTKCAYSHLLVETDRCGYVSGWGNVCKDLTYRCEYMDNYILKKDAVWSEEMNDWILKSKAYDHPKYGTIIRGYVVDIIVSRVGEKMSPFECRLLFRNGDIDDVKESYNVEEGINKDIYSYHGFNFSKDMFNVENNVPIDVMIGVYELKSGVIEEHPEMFPVNPNMFHYGGVDEITFNTFNLSPSDAHKEIKFIPVEKFVKRDATVYIRYKNIDKSKLNPDYVEKWSDLLEDYHTYSCNTYYSYEELCDFYTDHGLEGLYKSIIEFVDDQFSGKKLVKIQKDIGTDLTESSIPTIKDLVKIYLFIYSKTEGQNGLASFYASNASKSSIDDRSLAIEIGRNIIDRFVKFMNTDKGVSDMEMFTTAKFPNDDEVIRLLEVKI